ncbi:hypothetical protein [Cecembia calidifontis]|uniref:Uncharacterized protein n=1 Tax=Cecembia calidifontis TaxID=1187080 RepID=A0A4Q7P7B4_9BACT|nr:hypothetical protein [Cecembia calidifontis]RZS94592.1 hypothetical protein BC751_0093 [Cecembia calidifontis]
MRKVFLPILIGLFILSSCGNKEKSEKHQIEYLNLTPIGFFDELKHDIFLTETKITADSTDLFLSVGHQGLLIRTDSLLNLVSLISGKDKYPDFEFPSNMIIKGDTIIVEELAYQRLFLLDKNDFDLIDMIKFPFFSLGIGIDISNNNNFLKSAGF